MDSQHCATPEGIFKVPTGIEGIDEITCGGLPRSRTTLVVGGPGSGKTVLAMEFLVNGITKFNEPGIFVAFEENSRQLSENACTFGWDLAALGSNKLYILDARMFPDVITSGTFDTTSLLTSLSARVAEMGATRIVFDSIDILMTLLNDPTAERRELYRIRDWLDRSNLTGIVTARMGNDESVFLGRYAFMQYMADCVVQLTYDIVERVSMRLFRVVKYRGSSFAENEFPMVINEHGIEVASVGITGHDINYDTSRERISTGVARMDTMLDGGYYRGTSILITGAPGTAKSTLCGEFIQAACERGERCLYISFDEGPEETIRNLSSVGIQLEPHVKSGLLRMYSARSEGRSPEEFLMIFRQLMSEHRPTCMVVDPLSSLGKSGRQTTLRTLPQRLLHLTKMQGITLLTTSLLAADQPETEASPLEISTIADTWIHLSYRIYGGERNRALTIVKSRGTRHSNQVRELILTDNGVTLTDVYTAGGEVLMGTMRIEREAQERYEQERARMQINYKELELATSEAEVKARMEALDRELQMRRAELELLERERQAHEEQFRERQAERYRLRYGDVPGATGTDLPQDGEGA